MQHDGWLHTLHAVFEDFRLPPRTASGHVQPQIRDPFCQPFHRFEEPGQALGGTVFAQDDEIDFNELRYSYGVGLFWYSPVGPLSLSYAIPINDEPGDDLEKFQFTIGKGFR